jgi:glutamate-1-semialdehyde 2,1-aminomutase
MAAGCAQLGVLLGDPTLYEKLNQLGDQMRDGLATVLDEVGIVAQVTGGGSIWGLHFTDRPPVSVRDLADANRWAGRVLPAYLLLEGVLVSSPYHIGLISTEHTEADVEEALEAHRRALERMKADGWLSA